MKKIPKIVARGHASPNLSRSFWAGEFIIIVYEKI